MRLSPLLRSSSAVPAACLCVALLTCGCKSSTPAASDAALAQNAQAQISTDTSLSGQPITVSVAKGVASLSGSVANDAQKTIAARDIAGIAGIKEVDNNLSVGAPAPVAAVVSTPPPAPIPVPQVQVHEPTRKELEQQHRDELAQRRALAQQNHQPAPIERPQQPYAPQQQAYNPPTPVAPPPPPPPAQPVFRNVSVPAGTTIPVRVTQTLDSATTQEGDSFSGVVASDVVIDGATVLPAGSAVSGHVDTVHEAGHFKGSSLLTVSLSSVSRRGDRLPISTDPYSVQGKGRGANSAEKIGGGAAVGAIIGGIFGGGKGAAIGAGAGGGLGAGAQAVTKGQQVQIPSETVVRFHLAAPLSVRVRAEGGSHNGEGLQPRNE
jgi:hypothetical protein